MAIVLKRNTETSNERKIKLIFANLTNLVRGAYTLDEARLIRQLLYQTIEKTEELVLMAETLEAGNVR